jgi:exopolyphosphatase/guanosine-5'-triphosphate,3'-diphosphate pyrophosphatase
MAKSPVAVIDIGSNSIKILIAAAGEQNRVSTLLTKTLDARISAGISHASPRLNAESMARGVEAIRELLADAASYSVTKTVLVATSAVRDAENGGDFREQVRAATGFNVRILSGDEEANLIGRGLTCDPALSALRDFYVFDLGGGSLECLAFRDRKIVQASSLRLGCVRLTEKLIADSTLPLSGESLAAIRSETFAQFTGAGFTFPLASEAVAVGTGGTVTTLRAILAAKAGCSLEETPTRVELTSLRRVLDEVSALPLERRKQIPGLPPARADVFPTALSTLAAVAELGGFDAYQHSFYNLRYGLAAEALDSN